MHSTGAPDNQADTSVRLRRNLTIWEAIGVSIALMAPAMAVNINPQGSASVVGRAVPLAFTLATVSALLIAYSFARLSQRFNHAGSVYGFVGATMGARSGIFSGWLLAITYAVFTVYVVVAAGRFSVDELRATGIWSKAPDGAGYAVAIVALGLICYLATRPARGGTRLMLFVEGTTLALISVVAIIILVRLIGDTAPAGKTFDLSVFSVPAGSGASSVFLGVVFGFLSFAGFEGAATLGEETKEPRRDVPRAIVGTVIFGGLFFIVITAIQVMAFGTDKAGTDAYVASSSLMGDLGSSYVGAWIGHLITIGAAISAIACGLACVTGSARLIYALSRDGAGPRGLATVSETHQVPARAVAVITSIALVILLAGAFVFRVAPLEVAIAVGTAGTLILLVAYLMASLGSIKLLFLSGETTVRRWEVIVPVLGVLVLAYTMFRNVYPFPSGSAWWGPGLFIAAVVLTGIGVAANPKTAERAGRLLMAEEGLSTERSTSTMTGTPETAS